MLFGLLELASNKALDYDSTSLERLSKLHGKTMCLHIKNLDASISVMPQAEGIEFSRSTPEKIDVTLSTTVSAILKISRYGLENAELDAGELEMSGDPIVGQRFAQLMSDLNIDWETLLADHIGEAPARTAGKVAIQAKEFTLKSRSKLHDVISQIIKDDMQAIVGADEVDPFLNDVDMLRASVDRLSVRLSVLAKKLS